MSNVINWLEWLTRRDKAWQTWRGCVAGQGSPKQNSSDTILSFYFVIIVYYFVISAEGALRLPKTYDNRPSTPSHPILRWLFDPLLHSSLILLFWTGADNTHWLWQEENRNQPLQAIHFPLKQKRLSAATSENMFNAPLLSTLSFLRCSQRLRLYLNLHFYFRERFHLNRHLLKHYVVTCFLKYRSKSNYFCCITFLAHIIHAVSWFFVVLFIEANRMNK